MKQKYFCDILSISKKCGRRRFSAKVPSTWVVRSKIKLIQEISSTYSEYGIQSFRTHGRFVPRRFVPRLRCFVPTFGRFVPNPLVDSYPRNYDTKCFMKNINIYFTYPSNRKKLISNHGNTEKLYFC